MQIYIHIGPPKTGTSAIQNWCLKNRALLRSNKIYYPAHSLDKNGISSGNLHAIYERDTTGKLIFSEELLNQELRYAEESDADIILFSSEFFFKKAEELLEKIPNVKLIAYVRFGLEQFESSYNQAVKRHGKTNEISVPNAPRSQILKRLKRLGKGNHGQIVFRSYGDKVFSGGNIVSDLLSSLKGVKLDGINVRIKKRINTRYSYEGLQLKRWFNKFELNDLQRHLDTFLQKQGSESSKYSLIGSDKFEVVKQIYYQELKEFLSLFDVANSGALLAEYETSDIVDFKLQHIPLDVFSQLVNEFIQQSNAVSTYLLQFLKRNTAKTRMDYFRFKIIEEALIKNASVVSKIYGKKVKLALTSSLLSLTSRFTPSQNPNKTSIRYVYYDVPFSSDFFWLKALQRENSEIWHSVYGNDRELAVNPENIDPTTEGIIGHIRPTKRWKVEFEDAKHVLFLQRPIERLWLHINYVLDTKTPTILYQELSQVIKDHEPSSLMSLMEYIVCNKRFEYMINTYSTYLSDVDVEFFSSIYVKNKGATSLIGLPCSAFPSVESAVETIDFPQSIYKLENFLEKDNRIFEKFQKAFE